MSYLMLALILAAAGLILFLAEYFFSTGGFLIVGGILCFVGAVIVVGAYGSTAELAAAAIAVALGVPLATMGGVYAWKKAFGSPPSPDAEATIAQMPELAELAALKGRVGRTMSPMRPSGMVDFDGRKVDALTEGGMLDADVWVACVDVKSGKVIVRRVETPTAPAEARPVDNTPAPVAPPKKRTLEDMEFG
jgi:membrane-bound serine protease (ClpP class)